jgi:hypothetical protein
MWATLDVQLERSTCDFDFSTIVLFASRVGNDHAVCSYIWIEALTFLIFAPIVYQEEYTCHHLICLKKWAFQLNLIAERAFLRIQITKVESKMLYNSFEPHELL